MQRNLSDTESATLTRNLSDLGRLDVGRLNDRFRSLYGTEPPMRLRRPLLIRAVAYRLQERALGGLKPTTRRLLASAAAADTTAPRTTPAPCERRIKPGTTLLREWHGV
jgi:hypothetical protein